MKSTIQIAEIIAIGSELLLGGSVDTNSLFLSERLADLGVPVRFKTVVGDEAPDIAHALRTAVRRADLVVITGGLGPTCDDCTREAVAKVTGRSLRRHPQAAEGMRRRLAAWGRVPSRAQFRQALVPRGAEVLPNPVGSAPGFCLSWNRTFVAALPGVPAEAKDMFDEALLPRLVSLTGQTAGSIQRRVLHTFGLPEADVDQEISPLVKRNGRIRIGLLASPLGVSIVLTTMPVNPRRRGRYRMELDRVEQAVRQRLGRCVYGVGEETMEEVVGRQLIDHRLTVAVAESCTGGLIGHRLTEVPGSSRYVERVVVSYSNRAKTELRDVPARLIQRHGAVSAEVAAAMARGVRIRSRTDVGLSVTGIAGPDGGSTTKPVGLVYIGLDAVRFRDPVVARGGKDRAGYYTVREYRFHGNRQVVKLRASQAALDLLRQWLSGRRQQHDRASLCTAEER